ncbi:unnamed protein product [Tetraodon nigroviridis]|uniref:(spotted green pufferfish) hypothetical protein n=1 Tax=Tetraodon nigroviridis TaxID=99883 RepID=Q4S072_TETNG|nr:unnamed protein product [Tetraodon nigroviridis]
MRISEERECSSSERGSLLMQELDDCCQSRQTANDSICRNLSPFLKLLKHLVKALEKWEWGNTRNFLYKYQDFQTPPQLHSKDIIYLIDAGLWMNLPFPPFLGHKRAVDLIIALDFSAGKAFESEGLSHRSTTRSWRSETGPEIVTCLRGRRRSRPSCTCRSSTGPTAKMKRKSKK